MTGTFLAGIDIGTTGAKAIVFDGEGKPLASAYNEYPCTYPRSNWVEQDADLVVEATMRSVRESVGKSEVVPASIASVSVSAQRSCGIFLGARGEMLRPFAHDRACLARAFMEGITLDMMDMIQGLTGAGVAVDKVRILGGPTRSELWNQIQADVYGVSVQTLKVPDATVLGAAILGAVGAGVFSSIEEGADQMVRVDKYYEPRKEIVHLYRELYATYCRLYQAIDGSGSFQAIASRQS